jgi:ribose-phosphate pyrophosphokinase
MVYGQKVRNWETGKIEGLEVMDKDGHKLDDGNPLSGKSVLMIDDIISYGGTMYYSAKKLKELGAERIFAYATHVENSILDPEKGTFVKCLDDGTVDKLYTTDSIFTKSHKKIKLFA